VVVGGSAARCAIDEGVVVGGATTGGVFARGIVVRGAGERVIVRHNHERDLPLQGTPVRALSL